MTRIDREISLEKVAEAAALLMKDLPSSSRSHVSQMMAEGL